MSSNRQNDVPRSNAGYLALLVVLGGSAYVLAAGLASRSRRDSIPRATSSTRNAPDTGLPAVDGLFEVGGHQMYLKCEGSGSSTVVYLHGFIETPAGGGSQNAGLVPSLLREHAQVCVYDRANVGHSGSLRGPLTGKSSVADLHRLLAAAHIPGPYVLVGASFGGLIAVMYAATYPEDVAGMVLLDASLPDDVIKVDNRFLPREAQFKADDWKRNIEQIDRGATYREARAMQGRVPNIPLTYIATSRIALESSWPIEQMTAAIRAEQRAFVTRFSRGRLIQFDVPHDMEPAIPGIIADEIKRVIAAVNSR
jgi:pimeloyl-ACP methyl ester carboxylesterase